jgi:hypothetical protein
MGDRRSNRRLLTILVGLGLCNQAVAADIVRWVDADGVTQFTDPQLAAASATVVHVQPTNAMVVPTGAPQSNSRGPVFTKISRPAKKNKRGWRGYQSGRNSSTRSYRR